MKNFRLLCSAIVLTLMLAISAIAGETQTPPGCTDPGETNSPPCPGVLGETQGPSLTAPEDMEPSVFDFLMFALKGILPE